MTCDEMRHLMYDSLSGELAPEEEEKLRLHLDGCPGCSEYYRRTEEIAGRIRRMEAVRPSPDVCARTLEMIGGRKRSRYPFFFSRPALAAAAAVLALLIGAGVAYYLQGDRTIEMDGRASTIAHRPLTDADVASLRKEYLDESDLVLTMILDISTGKAPYNVGDVKNRIVAKDLLYAGSVIAATTGDQKGVCEDINAVLLDVMKVRTGDDGEPLRAIAMAIRRTDLIGRLSEERRR